MTFGSGRQPITGRGHGRRTADGCRGGFGGESGVDHHLMVEGSAELGGQGYQNAIRGLYNDADTITLLPQSGVAVPDYEQLFGEPLKGFYGIGPGPKLDAADSYTRAGGSEKDC
jgi:hypothetical protein